MAVMRYYLMDFSNSSRIDVSFVNEILIAASPSIFSIQAHFNAPPCPVQDARVGLKASSALTLLNPRSFNGESKYRNTES